MNVDNAWHIRNIYSYHANLCGQERDPGRLEHRHLDYINGIIYCRLVSTDQRPPGKKSLSLTDTLPIPAAAGELVEILGLLAVSMIMALIEH